MTLKVPANLSLILLEDHTKQFHFLVYMNVTDASSWIMSVSCWHQDNQKNKQFYTL